MEKKERFISLCKTVNREGMDGLLKWLEENDFYACPASSKYHGAYPGGLLEHSLNVYDELKRLLSVYSEVQVPEESVVIAALFHDLCKVNLYTGKATMRTQFRRSSALAGTEVSRFSSHSTSFPSPQRKRWLSTVICPLGMATRMSARHSSSSRLLGFSM